MKKIIAIAALLLISVPARADFLQTADEAALRYKYEGNTEGENAALEIKDYVFHSGAAENPIGEMRRVNMVSYMLNREKQVLDFNQGLYMYAYDISEESSAVEAFSQKSYEYAKKANAVQKEIDKNEKYLKKLSTASDKQVKTAEQRIGKLPEEKSFSPLRAIIDGIVFLALAALCVFARKKSKGYLRERGR